ncbi:MAG: DUF1573 domain-containing protein [Saprospiraceae bacterium]|nr:DUF1573 domain-containing protein [Saprospiraceae bacterium]
MLAFLPTYFSLVLTLNVLTTPSKIEWTTPTSHDFGLIRRGISVKHIFTFRNLSNAPLTIDNVRTDCSCTASDWNIEPIAPDAIGKITVEYDAQKQGYFKKRLTVWLHGQKQAEKLQIVGEVDDEL